MKEKTPSWWSFVRSSRQEKSGLGVRVAFECGRSQSAVALSAAVMATNATPGMRDWDKRPLSHLTFFMSFNHETGLEWELQPSDQHRRRDHWNIGFSKCKMFWKARSQPATSRGCGGAKLEMETTNSLFDLYTCGANNVFLSEEMLLAVVYDCEFVTLFNTWLFQLNLLQVFSKASTIIVHSEMLNFIYLHHFSLPWLVGIAVLLIQGLLAPA